MNSIQRIIQQAQANLQNIVLPEAEDARIIEAASIVTARSIASITLLGARPIIESTAAQAGLDLGGINIIDPREQAYQRKYSEVLYQARRHKGMTIAQATPAITAPLLMAATMVAANDAAGMVAGATHATADVVRNALQMVGMRASSKIVSSFFLMQHHLPHQALQGTAIYADCGLVIAPDAEQLACIAIDSATSATTIAGIAPKVALLSFSTAGSAEHASVDKVRAAGAIVAKKRPDIPLMTEVQFDAAILPDILQHKAPQIKVAAPANVLIFPDLQSGNIGYKIAQRIGGVQAIGPILQGLKRPINDLSRGCSVDDIINLVAVTAVQAATNY